MRVLSKGYGSFVSVLPIFVFCGVLLFPVFGFSDVLAAWEVGGVDADDNFSSETAYEFGSTSGSAQLLSVMTLGSGVNPSTSANQYGFKISSSVATDSLTEAIAENHFFQISLEVADGYELNLLSLEMKGQSSGLGCTNVVLMSSLDGFEAGDEIATAFPANQTGGFDTDVSGFGAPINLAASQYQRLTGSISFRVYGWNSESGSSSTHIRDLTGDDLVVTGTLQSIPEPTVLGLVLLVGTGAICVRRIMF